MLSLQEEIQRPIHKDTHPIFTQMKIAHLQQIALTVFQNHIVIVVRPIVNAAIDKTAESAVAHLPNWAGAPVSFHAAGQNSVINPHHKFCKIPGGLQTLRTKIGPLSLYLFPVPHNTPLPLATINKIIAAFSVNEKGRFGSGFSSKSIPICYF